MPSECSAGWRLEEWLDCSIKNEQEFWGAGMLRIGDGRETGRGRGRGREILNFEFWILNFGFWIARQRASLASTVIDRRYRAFHSAFKI
jgi:hypothetical protein